MECVIRCNIIALKHELTSAFTWRPSEDTELKYAFKLDFYAEVVPEVRCQALSFSDDFNLMVQVSEKCLTSRSITIALLKKHMNARYWPRLSKAVLAYVRTDFTRWTWEGDQADDVGTGVISGGDINSETTGVPLSEQVCP